jgi:glycosyltransferase involved in cell wall biosynthesis
LVVVNGEDQEAAKRYNIVPADRIQYMPGQGVDTSSYRPEAVSPAQVQRVRAEMGLGSEDYLLLIVAEFIARKRHEDALRAFARLDRLDVHLALAGDGPLTDSMKALALELGIAERVHFLGYRTDVPVLLRASLALVLPSEQEGLPQCVGEALSLERPVIGSDIRGTRDLVQGGPSGPEFEPDRCGLLFRLGDVEDLARAMAWILDHPHEARSMGQRGRRRMVDYDIGRILSLYDSLYEKALKA